MRAVTVFDWIIIALLSFFAVKSILRGAIRDIASLLALILAVVASFRYYELLMPVVQHRFASPWAQTVAAGALVFLAVYFSILLVGWCAALLLQKLHLGFFDRCAGGVVGLLKGYLFVCCAVALLLLVPNGSEVIRNSRLSWYCFPAIQKALPYCPEPLRSLVKEKMTLLGAPVRQRASQ